MKHLHTQVQIDATPAVVWGILTDLSRYREWNPFVVEAEGTVAVGQRLRVRLQPPAGRAMTFRPTVTVVEPDRAFEWLGHMGVTGVFDGRHRYQLEAHDGGTRLVQSEQFTGLLVPVLSRLLDAGTRGGFEAMNDAIKARAEALARHDR